MDEARLEQILESLNRSYDSLKPKFEPAKSLFLDEDIELELIKEELRSEPDIDKKFMIQKELEDTSNNKDKLQKALNYIVDRLDFISRTNDDFQGIYSQTTDKYDLKTSQLLIEMLKGQPDNSLDDYIIGLVSGKKAGGDTAFASRTRNLLLLFYFKDKNIFNLMQDMEVYHVYVKLGTKREKDLDKKTITEKIKKEYRTFAEEAIDMQAHFLSKEALPSTKKSHCLACGRGFEEFIVLKYQTEYMVIGRDCYASLLDNFTPDDDSEAAAILGERLEIIKEKHIDYELKKNKFKDREYEELKNINDFVKSITPEKIRSSIATAKTGIRNEEIQEQVVHYLSRLLEIKEEGKDLGLPDIKLVSYYSQQRASFFTQLLDQDDAPEYMREAINDLLNPFIETSPEKLMLIMSYMSVKNTVPTDSATEDIITDLKDWHTQGRLTEKENARFLELLKSGILEQSRIQLSRLEEINLVKPDHHNYRTELNTETFNQNFTDKTFQETVSFALQYKGKISFNKELREQLKFYGKKWSIGRADIDQKPDHFKNNALSVTPTTDFREACKTFKMSANIAGYAETFIEDKQKREAWAKDYHDLKDLPGLENLLEGVSKTFYGSRAERVRRDNFLKKISDQKQFNIISYEDYQRLFQMHQGEDEITELNPETLDKLSYINRLNEQGFIQQRAFDQDYQGIERASEKDAKTLEERCNKMILNVHGEEDLEKRYSDQELKELKKKADEIEKSYGHNIVSLVGNKISIQQIKNYGSRHDREGQNFFIRNLSGERKAINLKRVEELYGILQKTEKRNPEFYKNILEISQDIYSGLTDHIIWQRGLYDVKQFLLKMATEYTVFKIDETHVDRDVIKMIDQAHAYIQDLENILKTPKHLLEGASIPRMDSPPVYVHVINTNRDDKEFLKRLGFNNSAELRYWNDTRDSRYKLSKGKEDLKRTLLRIAKHQKENNRGTLKVRLKPQKQYEVREDVIHKKSEKQYQAFQNSEEETLTVYAANTIHEVNQSLDKRQLDGFLKKHDFINLNNRWEKTLDRQELGDLLYGFMSFNNRNNYMIELKIPN